MMTEWTLDEHHMYEKFYYFVAGSSLLSERDMRPVSLFGWK